MVHNGNFECQLRQLLLYEVFCSAVGGCVRGCVGGCVGGWGGVFKQPLVIILLVYMYYVQYSLSNEQYGSVREGKN